MTSLVATPSRLIAYAIAAPRAAPPADGGEDFMAWREAGR